MEHPLDLVNLLGRGRGAAGGAQLLLLGFPQVVVAEVALEALQLGVVVVGRGVPAGAGGVGQACRKTGEKTGQRGQGAALGVTRCSASREEGGGTKGSAQP